MPSDPYLKSALRCAAVALIELGLARPSAAAEERDTQCRPLMEARSPCFAIEGRLSLYQGTPSWRIWRFDTKHILGVLDSSGKEAEGPEKVIPNQVWLLLKKDPDKLAVRGTYMLCPFTPQRPGEMQMVCIKAATHLRQVSSDSS